MDYERRKLHHHTGYFALNHVPYKTFANLKHTDVYDLLGDHLEILMNRQYAFAQVGLQYSLLVLKINCLHFTYLCSSTLATSLHLNMQIQ